MNPKNLLIKHFDYYLPAEKIARYPLAKRDCSKLLVYRDKMISESIFSELPKYLSPHSLLVFNNTQVIEARLFFKKSTGTSIEIFCLEPAKKYTDLTSVMFETGSAIWRCLVGNAKKWKAELLSKNFYVGKKKMHLIAKKIQRQEDIFFVEFSWNDSSVSFAEILHVAGLIPLPPYLHRDAEKTDSQNYQTVYAKKLGSVAAPTAGLHFTQELFEELKLRKIKVDFITLHVGAGTFMPVKSESIRRHEMHAECFEVSKEFLELLISNTNGNIIAVGTTSLRTLESLYWMGIKLVQLLKEKKNNDISTSEICVNQWEPYELPDNITVQESLLALLLWMHENKLATLIAKTRIMIAPPYKLKIVKSLVTNFHQPRSTLLLLVAAVIGSDWKEVYEYALSNNFRFLSYGDSCLFFPKL